jgi:hypothetical protein
LLKKTFVFSLIQSFTTLHWEDNLANKIEEFEKCDDFSGEISQLTDRNAKLEFILFSCDGSFLVQFVIPPISRTPNMIKWKGVRDMMNLEMKSHIQAWHAQGHTRGVTAYILVKRLVEWDQLSQPSTHDVTTVAIDRTHSYNKWSWNFQWIKFPEPKDVLTYLKVSTPLLNISSHQYHTFRKLYPNLCRHSLFAVPAWKSTKHTKIKPKCHR